MTKIKVGITMTTMIIQIVTCKNIFDIYYYNFIPLFLFLF